eukprot:TRINITY_DN8077_c0_g1_i1.p1 TRINITY_DN8077_c0_g1~~TRINITY_DN8077_c0_g1_i1.p1  ORF type:complete len:273 (+),score=55.17 TRINITY_DN8077_c0_g1_i1:33-821(+)
MEEIQKLLDLKNEDTNIRLNTIDQLDHIAIVLGEERTRLSLIPFITECLDDVEIVLVKYAEKLTQLVRLLGEGYASVMVMPFEVLLQNEASTVRRLSIEGICAVDAELSEGEHVELMVPLFQRLALSSWHTSRCSACDILPTVYKRSDGDVRLFVQDIFLDLCRDKIPMVRRHALDALKDVVPFSEKEYLLGKLMVVIQELSDDPQDSVRLMTVEGVTALCSKLEQDEVDEYISPLISKYANDPSWRVRYSFASQLPKLLSI